MYSRLLSIAISLFPHNSRQSLDNPVQWHRLPDHSGVELDYPVFQDTPQVARQKTAIFLLLVSLIGPLMWLDTALVTIFKLNMPLLDGSLKIFVLLTATAFLIFGTIGTRWPLTALAMGIFVIPVLAQLLTMTPLMGVAFIPALLGIFCLSDRLSVFYLYLRTAAPLDSFRSRALRYSCKWRWLKLRSPNIGAELYALNFLALHVPFALICIHLALEDQELETLSVSSMFFVLTCFGVLWPSCLDVLVAIIYRRRPLSPLKMFGAFSRALVEWYTYNRLNARGVGVHQNPAGSCRTRSILLMSVVFFWGCVFIGSQKVTFDLAQPDSERHQKFINKQLSPVFDTFGWWPAGYRQTVGQKNQHLPTASLFVEPELDEVDMKNLYGKNRQEREQYFANRREGFKRLFLERQKESARQYQDEFLTHQQKPERRSSQNNGTKTADLIFMTFLLVAALAVSVAVPTLGTLVSCLALIYAVSARFVAGVDEMVPNKHRKRVLSSDNWEFLVERVRNSRDPRENDSIFMGTNSRDDTPILIPREAFQEHAHILGDSGSGKTSLGIMPLVSQLIRRGDASVIVIDLKADDLALFETLQFEAENVSKRNPPQSKYQFRWFTSELEKSSYLFNPLAQRFMSRLPDYQRADILTAAMGLQYGTDYGRKHFGDANFELLQFVLTRFPNIESFTELSKILQKASSYFKPDLVKTASSVIMSVNRLSRCKPLNGSVALGTPQSFLDNAIDFNAVFDTPQAIYFGLPPVSGISTTANIARFAIYSLLGAAQMRAKKDKIPVYLVIDEFQRIVSNNLALFLQTARSMGIGVILSNQSLSDLELADANLIPAVRTNTRFRQVFAVGTRDDIRDIRDTAGETLVGMRSWQILPQLFGQPFVQSMNVRETMTPRMMLNDILLATDAPGRSIACLRRGGGYAQFGGMPFIMDSVHHISRENYKARRDHNWPSPNEGCDVAKNDADEEVDEDDSIEGVIVDVAIAGLGGSAINIPTGGSAGYQEELKQMYEKMKREEDEREAERKSRKKRGRPEDPLKDVSAIRHTMDNQASSLRDKNSPADEEQSSDTEDAENDFTQMDEQFEQEESERKERTRRKKKKQQEDEDDRDSPIGGGML